VGASPIFEWLFRNRSTGEITVGQLPNAPLWVFIVAWGLALVLDPGGALGTGLDVVAGAALLIWAGDEILRGVNPFRRLLGAVVLGALLARFL
jgi:hypothetical protein